MRISTEIGNILKVLNRKRGAEGQIIELKNSLSYSKITVRTNK